MGTHHKQPRNPYLVPWNATIFAGIVETDEHGVLNELSVISKRVDACNNSMHAERRHTHQRSPILRALLRARALTRWPVRGANLSEQRKVRPRNFLVESGGVVGDVIALSSAACLQYMRHGQRQRHKGKITPTHRAIKIR